MTTRQHVAALTASYHTLNAQYFGGQLPPRRIRYGVPPGAPPGVRGKYDQYRRTIWIFPGHSLEGERDVLLHEMCHVADRGLPLCAPPSKLFYAALQSLADQGETWALESGVLEALWHVAKKDPTLSWRRARNAVAAILGWEVKRIAAVCPLLPWLWEGHCGR